MDRSKWIVSTIVGVILLGVARDFFEEPSDTIEYRGREFKMARTYASYEDYKGDPDNLNTNELPRIQAAIIGAKIGTNFDNRKQWIHAVFDLQFPGYGASQFGERKQTDGSTLSMFSVEIPHRDMDRYFVARENGHGYTVVDDFLSSSASNVISNVQLANGGLRYYSDSGAIVRQHSLTQLV